MRAQGNVYDVALGQAVLNFLSDLQTAGDNSMPIGFIHREGQSDTDVQQHQ